jgi:hypothetical protein
VLPIWQINDVDVWLAARPGLMSTLICSGGSDDFAYLQVVYLMRKLTNIASDCHLRSVFRSLTHTMQSVVCAKELTLEIFVAAFDSVFREMLFWWIMHRFCHEPVT